MKILNIVLLSIVFFLNSYSQEKTKNTNAENSIFLFDKDHVGRTPESWTMFFTGNKGEESNWKIVDDHGNRVLAQLSEDNPNYHFNGIVYDNLELKNVELTVKIKGVKGEMDQGGGFVWRYINADNYYVVRANPLEDNVVLYKVENAKRTDLPLVGKGRTYGADVPPLGEGWNTLKIKVVDNIFSVYLNDNQIFQVKDDTFKNAGKVGLWTKADAVTYFDVFEVKRIL